MIKLLNSNRLSKTKFVSDLDNFHTKLNRIATVWERPPNGSVVEWLKHRTDDQHNLSSKPTCAILLCPWKDTLRRFPLLGGLDKQF